MKILIVALAFAMLVHGQSATFPSAVATDAQLKVAKNRMVTTLRGSISASDTTITVADATRIEANMLLTIDAEIVSVTSVSGNNLTVVRGFNESTAAAHSSGRTVSAFITAWHHNALKAEVKAIETALGPNLSNITGTTATISTTYNFSPQTPGGSLIVGANVITLTPCPVGVSGTNTNHNLYISGGTGTAEAVPITGGTCTGSGTGTVIVTAANTHSGAWTIRSATAGIQEAAWATSANARVAIHVPPGSHTIYGKLTLPVVPASQQVVLIGDGVMAANLLRDTLFTTGDMISVVSPGSVEVANLTIDNTTGTSGVAIGALAAAGHGGNLKVTNVTITSGQYGVVSDGYASTQIRNTQFTAGVVSGVACFRFAGTNQAPGNVQITDSFCAVAGTYTHGLLVESVDGMLLDTVWFGSLVNGVTLSPAAGKSVLNVFMSNLLIDKFTGQGVALSGSPGNILNVRIADSDIHCQDVGQVGIDLGYSNAAAWREVVITGNNIDLCELSGILIGTSTQGVPGHVIITGNSILDNNTDNTAGHGGIFTAAGAQTGLTITGNKIRNISVTGSQDWAINIQGALTDGVIVGNDMRQNDTGTVNIGGAITHLVMSGNLGLENVAPTAIASGATIALGVAPYYTISGTTTVATMNGGWIGRRVKLRFTDAAPGGMNAAGNIYYAKTLTQNQAVDCEYDGTKWACVGP